MGVIEVTFYKGECDHNGCKADPMDEDEYAAWGDPSQVIESAQNADWYTATAPDGTPILLCRDHAPVCSCIGCEACKTYPDGNCKVRLLDDEWDGKCEDCFIEAEEQP